MNERLLKGILSALAATTADPTGNYRLPPWYYQDPQEAEERLAAAQAKRERRQLRNLHVQQKQNVANVKKAVEESIKKLTPRDT